MGAVKGVRYSGDAIPLNQYGVTCDTAMSSNHVPRMVLSRRRFAGLGYISLNYHSNFNIFRYRLPTHPYSAAQSLNLWDSGSPICLMHFFGCNFLLGGKKKKKKKKKKK